MNNEEALRDMKNRCSECKTHSFPDEEECEWCYFPAAIAALEKQISIKVKANNNRFNCSRCGRSHHIILNYCCWCGQKFEEKEV